MSMDLARSDLDKRWLLRAWAVEQAVALGANPKFDDVEALAERLVAYVQDGAGPNLNTPAMPTTVPAGEPALVGAREVGPVPTAVALREKLDGTLAPQVMRVLLELRRAGDDGVHPSTVADALNSTVASVRWCLTDLRRRGLAGRGEVAGEWVAT